MADFETPFAADAERRAPTSTEQSLGFPCGPASQKLFNYLFWLMTGQVKNIADVAGVASTEEGDHTVLRRAVEEMIAAAVAAIVPPEEPDLSPFVTINQARARLPFFPEVLNTDGRIVVTSPGTGQVRLPGGVDFLHRGIFQLTTAQTDFNTDPSKIYHLRWDPTNGYRLLDLAGAGYNPTALSEISMVFDSKYDDMLIARVVTNSSNVPTITNLANKHQLRTSFSKLTKESRTDFGSYADLISAGYFLQQNLNWARTPMPFLMDVDSEVTSGVDSLTTPHAESTRYITKAWAFGYGLIGTPGAYQSGTITVGLMA